MSKIENKIYEYNAQPKEKKYLKYNGKEYLINTGYKILKKTTKLLSKIDNLEDNEAMDELESVVISLIGEKVFDAISDNPDFDYMEFTKLIKIIIGAIQGVEPEDMDEDFFQEIETK